jgi:hypothetical protein
VLENVLLRRPNYKDLYKTHSDVVGPDEATRIDENTRTCPWLCRRVLGILRDYFGGAGIGSCARG